MNAPAPALALALFGAFLMVAGLLFWPNSGLVARARRNRRRSADELNDDIAKYLFHHPGAGRDAIAGFLSESGQRVGQGLNTLLEGRLVTTRGEEWVLTAIGSARAAHLVRAHRLWERYLADRTGVAEVDWHPEADRKEHELSPADADRLAERMGRPLIDPHGDPIPGAGGEVPTIEGWHLAEAELGEPVEVLHLEDEPAAPYERLVRLGLTPGDLVVPVTRESGAMEIRWDDHSAVLQPDEVEAVTVGRVTAPAPRGVPLSTLPPGASARVTGLTRALRGPQRRRLLDLGFVPGTVVEAEYASAMGDPVAYRVRGALIALRREQADSVLTEATR
jgi:DtxR family Mn-dependent transcriptional regulator